MNAKVIFNIANISFETGGTVTLTNGDFSIVITNKPEFKEGLYSQNLLHSFGAIIERKGNETIGLGQIDFSGSSIVTPSEFERLCFDKFIQANMLLDSFVQSLWFSKDNSVSVVGSYFEVEKMNHINKRVQVW